MRRKLPRISAFARTPQFSGALAWPYIYPWPQRPAGLIETAFDELAARWKPILNAFDAAGLISVSRFIPAKICSDGATFEMFLERVGNHPRCNILFDPSHFVLQQLDYLEYLDLYHQRIKMFHVKDAEFNPLDVKVCTAAINLDQPRRPFSFARGWPGGFQRDFLQAHAI